jgi:hypothetical protein
MRAKQDRARLGRLAMWATIAGLLVLPLVAMRFTDEVAWTAADFAAAAVLLGGAGAIYEIATRRAVSSRRKAVIATALVAIVVLVWLEGAVGIFS